MPLAIVDGLFWAHAVNNSAVAMNNAKDLSNTSPRVSVTGVMVAAFVYRRLAQKENSQSMPSRNAAGGADMWL